MSPARVLLSLLALAPVVLLAACGEEEPTGRPLLPDRASRYVGQEVWVAFEDPVHETRGIVGVTITRKRAKQIAEDCLARARGGADMGWLASRFSNARAGAIGGFTGPLPANPTRLDARDHAIMATPIGELTELIEWRKGFWFARRVTLAEGKRLTRRAASANKVRAQVRVIHIHHRGAIPSRHEFDEFFKPAAIAKAETLIRRIKGGEALPPIAKNHSNDGASAERGGLLLWTPHGETEPTNWVTWRARRWFHYHLLEVILEEAPVGRVYEEPVISPHGVDIVYVIKRETD